MTHWSTRRLARIAVKRGLVSQIAHSTISLILRDADLQPHRSRYWITPTLDAKFMQRAGRILWLYERVDWLWAHDEIVLALDEKPSRLSTVAWSMVAGAVHTGPRFLAQSSRTAAEELGSALFTTRRLGELPRPD